jgi:hypothetical protein
MLVLLVQSPLCLLWTLGSRATALAQTPGPSYPVPAINVRDFGARDDAQEAVGCSLDVTKLMLTCGTGTFASTDVGKTVQIPKAGAAQSPPLPAHATYSSTIISESGGTTVTLAAAAPTQATSVPIVWGTDNAPAFQGAANACPAPSNALNAVLFQFTSKGCAYLVPNGGSLGTGDYMFGSTVTFATQTSFQIIGMGNSGKYEQSPQAGVRLVTALPITILSVGQSANPSGGGFQIENITFRDVSNDGSAIGGLLMNGISEAIIAYCSFENFNGQQPDAAPSTIVLSYGMKATTYGSGTLFNNNMVLLHDKGEDNSIWYDGSNGAQDGPIVIGGDIFPNNGTSSLPTLGPWDTIGTACVGLISAGPIRVYGTHFDVSTDMGGTACLGVITLRGGIVNAKIESSAGGGHGALLYGGQTTQITLTAGDTSKSVGSNGSYVTVTETNSLTPGQSIVISHPGGGCSSDQANLDGTFLVTSASTSQFTYDYPGNAYTSSCNGTANPKYSTAVRIDGIFNALKNDVTINSGATDNSVVDSSPALGSGGTHFTDNGTNDIFQLLDAQAGTNSTTLNGTLTPTAAGGMGLGSAALPFSNLWIGAAATNNIEITGTATAARIFTLPDANSNPVQPAGPMTNEFVNQIGTSGLIGFAQPSFSNLSGSVACSQLPALTGDTTTSAGTCTTTTGSVNGVSYPSSPTTNTVPQVSMTNTVSYGNGLILLYAFCAGTIGTGNLAFYVLQPALSTGTSSACSGAAAQELPMPLPVSGTVSHLYATASAVGGTTNSGIVTFYKNGTATTLHCALGTGLSCNNISNTVTMNGTSDTWSVRVKTGQASDSTADVKVMFWVQ